MLLRVSACGVCHSDIHIADGYFDLGQGQKLDLAPAVKLPRILGHEIAGIVEELGPDATGVNVGDRRAVYAWGGCGRCAQCRAGQENLCAKPRNLSVHADGGFSNYVLVEHPRYLVEYEPLVGAVRRDPRVFRPHGVQRAEEGRSGRCGAPAPDHWRGRPWP